MSEYVPQACNLPVDPFVRAYLEAAEWAGLADEDREALEAYNGRPSWDAETLARVSADCATFQRDNAELLGEWTEEQAGHDFYLTRNRHGAGFWDRGKVHGDALSKAATKYRETYVSFDPETELLREDA